MKSPQDKLEDEIKEAIEKDKLMMQQTPTGKSLERTIKSSKRTRAPIAAKEGQKSPKVGETI